MGRTGKWLFLAAVLVISAARADDLPLRQAIDADVKAAWQREKVNATARCDDGTFLRRVHLDLVGTLPTYEDTVAFLKDANPDKRTKMVDQLLDDPRFARHQADVWFAVLFGRSAPPAVTQQKDAFHKWLTERFAKNDPYDKWVRELLLAEGNTAEHGPPLFYVQFGAKAEETAVGVSRIFLGTQLQCAQCHDHPSDKWKQLDFYGLAGFFARLVVVDQGGGKKLSIGEKSTGEVMFTGPASEQRPGQKGKPVPARFLGGDLLSEPPLPDGFKEVDLKANKAPPKPVFSRKEKFAGWMTSAENPYFARAAVNRVWGQFLGRGLVHPVDDMRESKPASHPELLEALTRQFVQRQFDLKWLIRELVNSETYQLAPGQEGEAFWFEKARLRPLTGEEMLAAMQVATGFNPAVDKMPSGLAENILRHFGNAMDGRGDFQASLTERLFMNNNAAIRMLISRKKGNLADHMLTLNGAEERVDRLFLTVLGRAPRPEEKQKFVAHLSADKAKPEQLVEEAIWVLVNCSEFRFNH